MKQKKIKLVSQFSSSDCGLACLTMLIKSWGDNTSLYELISKARPTRDGLNIAQLKNVAKKHDFDLKAFKLKTKTELELNLPNIMPTKNGHYVVVVKEKKDKFTIYDPAVGKMEKSFEQIKKELLPILCTVTPNSDFKPQRNGNTISKIKNGILGSFNFGTKDILLVVISTLLLEFIVLFIPFLIRIIVNSINSTNVNTLSMVIALSSCIIGLFVLNLMFTWLQQQILLKVQTKVFKQVIKKLFFKLFNIDLTFYETHTTGDIINRFNNIGMINNFLSTFLIKLGTDILTGIFCLIVMLVVSYQLAIVIMIVALFEGILIYVLNNRLQTKAKEYISIQSQTQGDMVDAFNNIIQVMCMGSQRQISQDLEKKYFKSIDAFKEKGSVNNLLQSWLNSISVILSLIIYAAGFFLIRAGQINIGILIQVVSLSTFVMTPISTLMGSIPQIQLIKEIVDRLNEIIFYKGVNRDGQEKISNIDNISLEHVSFSYNEASKTGLKDISLAIPKGKKIALVGNSGGGKTTITKLIMNVFDEYSGHIYVNGVDYRCLDSNSLYEKISVVTQTPLVINGSIKDNLDFEKKLDTDRIKTCLKNAEALDFVNRLPLGMNTIMGDGGQNLSGGQKQRIAIARAISKQPDLMIFDEGTSSLDQLTERKIYQNLQELNITQLIVSHRLAAIQDADYIYVLSQGKIAEEGTHRELLKKRGLYYRNYINDTSYQ